MSWALVSIKNGCETIKDISATAGEKNARKSDECMCVCVWVCMCERERERERERGENRENLYVKLCKNDLRPSLKV